MPTPKIKFEKAVALNDDPNNARLHPDSQIEHVAGLIARFGWTRPIQVDVGADNMIVVGHGARKAAQLIYERGDKIYLAPGEQRGGAMIPSGSVPIMDVSGWTEEERRAVNLSDNRAGEMSGWDAAALAQSVEQLADADFTMAEIGFDDSALTELLAPKRGADDKDADVIPPVEETPISQLGDVWILGNHRIACGDSTDAKTVELCLAGAKPHLMVTDPPYGVEYDAAWREGAGLNRKGAATGKVLNDDNADWTAAWALFPGDVAYVWHAGLYAGVVADSLLACDLHPRSQIIWAKQQMVMSRGDYHWKHEPCWYAVRKGKKGHYRGGRKQTTVWEIDKPHKSETGHSTQKPIECMLLPIENNSEVGDLVYEPFSGSGTTIIAGEQSRRKVRAIELNPLYVDVAVRRWQDFTGQDAVRESDGKKFSELTASV